MHPGRDVAASSQRRMAIKVALVQRLARHYAERPKIHLKREFPVKNYSDFAGHLDHHGHWRCAKRLRQRDLGMGGGGQNDGSQRGEQGRFHGVSLVNAAGGKSASLVYLDDAARLFVTGGCDGRPKGAAWIGDDQGSRRASAAQSMLNPCSRRPPQAGAPPFRAVRVSSKNRAHRSQTANSNYQPGSSGTSRPPRSRVEPDPGPGVDVAPLGCLGYDMTRSLSSGVAPSGSAPRSAQHVRMPGSASAAAISRCRRSIMGHGVPRGAMKANHAADS